MDFSSNFIPQRPVLVPTIILLNVAVFILWHYLGETETSVMGQNFLVSWDALMAGRYWTLLTSVFSHTLFFHLFINMFVLNSFGRVLEQVLGRGLFLGFYLAAGILSSLSHCLVSTFILGSPEMPALGASGAIAGLVLVFAMMFPQQKILLFGLIPVPAIWGALGFIGLDVWGLVEQARGGGLPIGHGAHLGGAATGIFFYFFFIRRRIRRPIG